MTMPRRQMRIKVDVGMPVNVSKEFYTSEFTSPRPQELTRQALKSTIVMSSRYGGK